MFRFCHVEWEGLVEQYCRQPAGGGGGGDESGDEMFQMLHSTAGRGSLLRCCCFLSYAAAYERCSAPVLGCSLETDGRVGAVGWVVERQVLEG